MLTLKSRHTIYGCHYLKNQGGKCQNIHGHEYKIILYLSLSKDKLDKKNMILDTYEVEKIFNEFIGTDHLNLNEFIGSEDPTMEIMSIFFYNKLKKKIPSLSAVEVYETNNSSTLYIES
ncbi:MAG: 6-carboxytetrahydropterin synthase [Methanobrevibacter sp.]|nr:6-carboxytetrahydropterin synthase [Methanobrevibacter sp.]